jgi:hypothetical protein
LNFNYRGHEIRITRAGAWSAELVELSTGAVLPTKVTAEAMEALTVCVERAVCLVDLYLEGRRRRTTDGLRARPVHATCGNRPSSGIPI